MLPVSGAEQLNTSGAKSAARPMTSQSGAYSAFVRPAPYSLSGRNRFQRPAPGPAVDAVVLVGAGTTFIAGADIKIFAMLKTREQSLERSGGTHALLTRIEDCPKPVVAAIHGVALGGGNEVAMSCHYRIAARTASIGQPEVMLGIIPGAGGTQRLPRLCGPALALEMCTDGKSISADGALAAGI